MRLNPEQYTRILDTLYLECGRVLRDAMELPEVEDIVCNPDGRLWQKSRRTGWEVIGEMGELSVERLVQSAAIMRGREINAEKPVLESIFPIGDHRFEAIFPPITRRPVFSLRIRRENKMRLVDWETSGALTHKEDPLNIQTGIEDFVNSVRGLSHSRIITAGILAQKNFLMVGPTGSGKTSLGDTLLTEIGEITNDRVITIEDTPELYCAVPNSVDLLAVDGVSMLDCLKYAMRLRPKRIVVGEVRGPEAHALLKAWNTGHPGGIATVHADDAEAGLERLTSLVGEATKDSQRHLIAQAVDIVVFLQEDVRIPAGRKIRQVLAVTGVVADSQRYQTVAL